MLKSQPNKLYRKKFRSCWTKPVGGKRSLIKSLPKWQGRRHAPPPCTRLPVPVKLPKPASTSPLSSSNQYRLLGFQKLPKASSWWSATFSFMVSKVCSPHCDELDTSQSHHMWGRWRKRLSSCPQVGSWCTPGLFLVNASTICISLKFCIMLPGFENKM